MIYFHSFIINTSEVDEVGDDDEYDVVDGEMNKHQRLKLPRHELYSAG